MKQNANLEDIFGPVIHSYSRQQAIEDGVLVDVSRTLDPCPFKYPVAMTIGAWEATIGAGGTWQMDDDQDGETLRLPGCQDVKGRTHDVFMQMLFQIKNGPPGRDRINFTVLVDVHGTGRPQPVALYSVCGPRRHRRPSFDDHVARRRLRPPPPRPVRRAHFPTTK